MIKSVALVLHSSTAENLNNIQLEVSNYFVSCKLTLMIRQLVLTANLSYFLANEAGSQQNILVYDNKLIL